MQILINGIGAGGLVLSEKGYAMYKFFKLFNRKFLIILIMIMLLFSTINFLTSAVDEEFPDLEITKITIETDWPPTSPVIYKNDIATITAHLKSHYATFKDVTVNLSIYDINNNITFYNATKTNITVLKDIKNAVDFDWFANRVGDFTIKLTIYSDVDELNKLNNNLSLNITVNGWPDLSVENVIIPVDSVDETDEVKVYAIISNVGEVKATNYKIGLFIESTSHESMSYNNIVGNISVSIDKNDTKQISIYWNSAKPGNWMVGVKVLTNDTKRDTNIVNNQFLSNETLKVKGIERNPPEISNVKASPNPQEQGKSVKISAKVTDETGLESVKIVITNPNNKSYSRDMIRTSGDNFNFVFEDTQLIGTYNFKIEAIDTSYHENNASFVSNFIITKDVTLPIISFYDARPRIQTKGKGVEIFCIAEDNIGIKNVEVTIIDPDDNIETRPMTWSSLGKYIYTAEIEKIGKYVFYVLVKDNSGNFIEESPKSFWITIDKDDIDNDGIPDWWEEKYGLDPENPNDADNDKDGDGQSNLKEFESETNPSKSNYGENIAVQVKENALYLIGSVIFFIFLIILFLFARWWKLR